MSRVLLTGANGHLGANTARALLKAGHEVVSFVRQTSDLRGLQSLGLAYRYGDIRDPEAVLAAAEGCEAIIHTAGVFRYWIDEPDEILQPALLGVRNIFAAAQKFVIKRVIYTSSTYAIGFCDDPAGHLTVAEWNEEPQSPYAIAKTMAEREAWRLSRQTGVPMIALCPAGLWGPYDYRLTPPMRWIRDLVNGISPVIDAGSSFVDVRDAAEVHALSVDGGQPGRRYAIVGEDLTNRQIAEIVSGLTGINNFYINFPRPFMVATAGLMEAAAKVTGWDPLATRDFIRETLGRYQFVDGRETIATFGIEPRKGVEMITDAIRWLLFNGQIGTKRAARLAQHFPPDPDWIQAGA